MAVLASIDPPDGAKPVEHGYPVTAELTDSSDLDLSLIEIIVNGVSFTQANGGLVFFNITKLDGNRDLVYDYTDVFARIVGLWSGESWEQVSIEVKYDGGTVSTTSAWLMPWAQTAGFIASWGSYAMYPLRPTGLMNLAWRGVIMDERRAGNLQLSWFNKVAEPYSGAPILSFSVRQLPGWNVDAYYWIAHTFREQADSSTVVGTLIESQSESSVVVYGYVRGDALASSIVQGYFRGSADTSVVVGVRFRSAAGSSAIVGVSFLTVIPASAVVYAVRRGPLLEILVSDQSTIDALSAVGITFEGP